MAAIRKLRCHIGMVGERRLWAVRDNHGRVHWPNCRIMHISTRRAPNGPWHRRAAGADMNALDDDSYDVLTIAAVANDPDIVSLALTLGNRPDLVTSVYGGTALIAAAHLGHHEVVRRLIGGGAPLDHINNLNWTALIEVVVLGNGGPDHIATVRALVEAGADISIGDRDGVTALTHAQVRGYVEIAEIIAAAR